MRLSNGRLARTPIITPAIKAERMNERPFTDDLPCLCGWHSQKRKGNNRQYHSAKPSIVNTFSGPMKAGNWQLEAGSWKRSRSYAHTFKHGDSQTVNSPVWLTVVLALHYTAARSVPCRPICLPSAPSLRPATARRPQPRIRSDARGAPGGHPQAQGDGPFARRPAQPVGQAKGGLAGAPRCRP
jgi:hypothetical protein